MTQSIGGLASGLDTNSIITQLVSLERNSINLVQARATNAKNKLTAYTEIREQTTALRTAALAVGRAASWRTLTATSSDTDAVGVSAGTGSFGGTLTFNVDSLARAGSIRSMNTLAGTSATAAADAAILVAAGGARIGFATFASDDTLTVGEHDIVVTQSSEAAIKLGDTALASSTLIDGTNNTLNIDVNGVAKVLTIAGGTYTRAELADAVQDAADAAGAAITVTVDSATNGISIATSREGSTATIQVTGGNALTPLMVSTDGSPLVGVDGKVQVGDAPEQTFSSIEVGGSVVLNADVGTITATFSGGLREGTVTAENVAVGDGSLATVVANINAAQAGVTATAVQVGTGIYRLQVAANTAGALNGGNLAGSEFDAAVGGFVTLTSASDAQITVGEGDGAYTVVSETNTVSGLLPGVTVTLKQLTEDPVTITASRDVGAIAANIQAFVDAANALKENVDTLTKYDTETNRASVLTGDSAARRLLSDLTRAVTSAVPSANPSSPGLVGLSVDRTGKFTFDDSMFTEKFNEDPEGVTALFVQGGTASSSDVSFVSAGDRARAGSYAVVISQAATQAANTGLEGSWPIGSPPTIRVRVGATTVEYEVGATDDQDDVVRGLNAAFGLQNLQLTAEVDGTGISVTATQYGTAGHFEVAWDGATYTNYAGLDVAGTINGVTATGKGRNLTIPFDNNTIGGLSLQITATVAGALGTFDYQPGVGARALTNIVDATDLVTGYITSSEKALNSRIDFVDDQVASMERRLELYQIRLKKYYATLETTLSSLQQQSSWLAGQISGLNNS